MTRSLSEHLERADEIMSGLCKTLLPSKEPPAPVMCDASNRQIEYATTIRLVVEKHDLSGATAAFLRASDEAAPGMAREMSESLYNRVEADMRRMRKQLRRGGITVGRGR